MSWDWSKEDDDVVAVVNAAGETNRYYCINGDLMYIREGKKRLKSSINYDLSALKFNVGDNCHIRPEQPKWTIYNNNLPFGELNDEQKGALMVASLRGALFVFVGVELRLIGSPSWDEKVAYCAKQPKQLKWTMLEQLIADLPAVYDSYDGREALAQHLIDKGYHK